MPSDDNPEIAHVHEFTKLHEAVSPRAKNHQHPCIAEMPDGSSCDVVIVGRGPRCDGITSENHYRSDTGKRPGSAKHQPSVEITEPTKQREGDQPLPFKNERDGIQDLVIADIEHRKAVGIERYGQILKPFDGRNPVLDAYEEAIDLSIYLKKIMVEANEILGLTVAAEGGRQFLDKRGHLRSLDLLARISGNPNWSFLLRNDG